MSARRARMVYTEPLTEGGDPLFISKNAGELASLVLPKREWELLGNTEELIVTIESVEPELATDEFPIQPRTGGLPKL